MSIIISIAFIAFALVQIFAIVMIFILRYHFKIFALPDDGRARRISRLMTFGILLGFILSGVLVLSQFI